MELFNQTSYGIEGFSLSHSSEGNSLYIKALANSAKKLIPLIMTDQEELIFSLVVNERFTQNQIAERFHVSQSSVSRIFNKAKNKLRYALEISSLSIKQYIELINDFND